MKTNKMLFGAIIAANSIALAFAPIGGEVFTNAWVHVKFQGQTTFSCVDSGIFCNQVQPIPCSIFVHDLNRNTKGYYPGCTTAIYHSPIIDADYDPAQIVIDADPI